MNTFVENITIRQNNNLKIKDIKPNDRLGYGGKAEEKSDLAKNKPVIAKESDKLYANKSYSFLIVFQAMDAAKKDSTIKHVFQDVPPQIITMADFKEPSSKELEHDYLWRVSKKLPRRGQIGVFNRSHYEEVIATKVHPEYIVDQNIPGIEKIKDINNEFWKRRYRQINDFEKYLYENGYIIIKFFLKMSWEKQRRRFLRRVHKPDKHWKFSIKDVEERQYWDDYQNAYEEAIYNTSTTYAPWHVIPADHKWTARAAVSDTVVDYFQKLNLQYPLMDDEKKHQMQKAKEYLENNGKPL